MESTGSITELSGAVRLSRKCIVDPGTIQKVRCKVKGFEYSSPHGKIVVFTPFEELCVEKEIVILETTEKLLKRSKFIDVVLYNPTGSNIVLERGRPRHRFHSFFRGHR